MTKLERKHNRVACPSCNTVPLEKIEESIITAKSYNKEGNWHLKAKMLFPAYRHCRFCHSDFALK